MKCPWCNDDGRNHETGTPCEICCGNGTISDDWTTAGEMYEAWRRRRTEELAANIPGPIAPSALIDPEVMAEYRRGVEQFEGRKEVPR